jgi:hypothetical protein
MERRLLTTIEFTKIRILHNFIMSKYAQQLHLSYCLVPSHHSNINDMFLAIVLYILHTRNFVECKTTMQTCAQQEANG